MASSLRFGPRTGSFAVHRFVTVRRTFAAKAVSPTSGSDSSSQKASGKPTSKAQPVSSCPAGTLLTGVTWLKDQPPVLALPDEEYPPWLWDVLTPHKEKQKSRVDGEVSPEEQTKLQRQELRRANRVKIKLANFMKTA